MRIAYRRAYDRFANWTLVAAGVYVVASEWHWRRRHRNNPLAWDERVSR